MRTPTALLCIRAALGNRHAQKTLEGRRALKTPILTAIRNANREWKKGREGLRNSFDPPRSGPASRAGAPSLPFNATRPPAWVGNWRNLDQARPAMASVQAGQPEAGAARTSLLPDNHSWLHHGFGAGSALRDFLDPRCDRSTADLFGESRSAAGGGTANDGLSIATDDLPITIATLDTAALDMPAEGAYPDDDSDSDQRTTAGRRSRRFDLA
ncbi:hypothetical protein [Stenotrophomonas sp. AB1(2024)]|uniref:hypothetical protein n=1 Tax=Stenotrophomonas sp. AB1(2024) TaxID=3132215 RepID=UPI0030B7EEE3